ncbi:acid phosphatase-domain-containing protein [Jimgerdemannia flammicorona]|uniref:Acid phosphatase-domain-containing protein n=2 Tax=Jimgerdemannia flammicorona TaxID=994334 RepID=A0A433PBK3_9FUNG|nr:acid phosphatase-domain-containing protein [Jimgerdemannia flammicorona]RUS14903.1 acid phosphatase-domain-containing protein [Jimgerdemannia flammicorona]
MHRLIDSSTGSGVIVITTAHSDHKITNSFPRAKQVLSLLRLLPTPDHPIPTTFADAIAHAEIYPSSKRAHFRTLAEKTGIDYADMIFFDDELRNSEVTRMGVTFVLVNEDVGVTMDVFLDALTSFGKEVKKRMLTIGE